MAKRDYYEILGVAKDVDAADLKKAYRRVAMKFHPDRNLDDPTAEEKFKEANEAYEVLSNEDKRAAYDRFGHSGVDGQSGMGGAGAGAGFSNFSDIFGDVFGDIFGAGGRGGRGGATRGSDLRYNLELNLEEAVKGTSVQIKVPTLVSCKVCEGSGAKPGSKPVTCTTCVAPLFLIHVSLAMARVAPKKPKPCKLKSRRVWIPAIVFAFLAKVKPVVMVAQQAICMSKSVCANTRFSSAMAPTFTAKSPSTLSMQPSAVSSKYLRSMAA